MTGDSVKNQPALQPASFPGQPQLDLFCPRCAYPLLKVEEMGLKQCPDCGADLDFDVLRLWRREGTPPAHPWRHFWGALFRPQWFFESLPTPRYYIATWDLEKKWYDFFGMGAGGGMLAGLAIGVIATIFDMMGATLLALPISWVLSMLAAKATASVWIRWLLRRSGHDAPRLGAQRVIYLASPVHAAMGAVFCLLMALPIAAGVLGIWSSIGEQLLFWAAAFGLAFYGLLWVHWSWVVMRAFEAETRAMDRARAFWAFANPAIPLGLLMPLALGGCCIVGVFGPPSLP